MLKLPPSCNLSCISAASPLAFAVAAGTSCTRWLLLQAFVPSGPAASRLHNSSPSALLFAPEGSEAQNGRAGMIGSLRSARIQEASNNCCLVIRLESDCRSGCCVVFCKGISHLPHGLLLFAHFERMPLL